jgi:transcriptional regulator with XRE-family HTH domain
VDQKQHKDFLIAFGRHLSETRKKLGFSQERLAFEAEIELRQLGRIERGEINTGILSVKILSEALKITPEKLFSF